MTATAERKPMKIDERQGPEDVYPGDTVHWYDGDASGPAHPAVVDALGMGTALRLLVYRPEYSRGFTVKDGCKSASDPTLRDEERTSNGVWDYSPRTKEIIDLRKKVSDLTARVLKLEKKS